MSGFFELTGAFVGSGAGVALWGGVGTPLFVGALAAAGLAIQVPLSQTNFLPDLMQTNFLVVLELMEPALWHAAPGDGDDAVAVVNGNKVATSMAADT